LLNPAQFTFAETLADLKGIYDQYQLKKAILLGHSFGGGGAATRFAEAYPNRTTFSPTSKPCSWLP